MVGRWSIFAKIQECSRKIPENHGFSGFVLGRILGSFFAVFMKMAHLRTTRSPLPRRGFRQKVMESRDLAEISRLHRFSPKSAEGKWRARGAKVDQPSNLRAFEPSSTENHGFWGSFSVIFTKMLHLRTTRSPPNRHGFRRKVVESRDLGEISRFHQVLYKSVAIWWRAGRAKV